MSDLSVTRTSTVTPFPQLKGEAMGVSLSGIVTLEDYRKNFYEPMQDRLKEFGRYKMLMHYASDFQGWEKNAADLSFKSIAEMGTKAVRLAYVNPPERKILQTNLQRSMLGGEIRFFEQTELDKAVEWIGEA